MKMTLRFYRRHGPAWPGHPRLALRKAVKTWMPGTWLVLGPAFGRTRVPGMTIESAEASK